MILFCFMTGVSFSCEFTTPFVYFVLAFNTVMFFFSDIVAWILSHCFPGTNCII